MVNVLAHVFILIWIEKTSLAIVFHACWETFCQTDTGDTTLAWISTCEKLLVQAKTAVSPVLQAGEKDIIAVTWSPTKPSLVMALNSHSQLILLHINSQTCQPKVFDFVNTMSSKGAKAAITVSSCLISADTTFRSSHGLYILGCQMASFPQFANFHVVADVCTALQGIERDIATGEADDGHWF